MQANRRLKAFEEAWASKQKELESVLDGASESKSASPLLDKVTPSFNGEVLALSEYDCNRC